MMFVSYFIICSKKKPKHIGWIIGGRFSIRCYVDNNQPFIVGTPVSNNHWRYSRSHKFSFKASHKILFGVHSNEFENHTILDDTQHNIIYISRRVFSLSILYKSIDSKQCKLNEWFYYLKVCIQLCILWSSSIIL